MKVALQDWDKPFFARAPDGALRRTAPSTGLEQLAPWLALVLAALIALL